MTEPDTLPAPWTDLHRLWVALGVAQVPGCLWAEWNQLARRHGVEVVLRRLETALEEWAKRKGELKTL